MCGVPGVDYIDRCELLFIVFAVFRLFISFFFFFRFRYIKRVSAFFSLIIFVMVGVSVLCTCTLLYQIEVVCDPVIVVFLFRMKPINGFFFTNFQLAEELNYLLLQSIGIWLSAVSCLLIFCACGDWISGEAFKITTATYNSLWYHHAVPLDNRKFNILILTFAQKSININGLTVIQCSLESFLSVCGKKKRK